MRHQVAFSFASLFPGKITVDLFAGGGGTSTGVEAAIRRPVDIAVNHDAAAIAMHKANHPRTKHYQEDVFAVSPREACAGREVGMLWLSPACTHHSKAKGGTNPLSAEIRSLANVGLDWAREVRPDLIALENVEEFCFPPETGVLSKRGIVPIGDIKIGDEVWTHNARWKPVTAVARRTARTVSVIGYGNSIVETTENHEFYARQYAPCLTQSGKFGRHECRLLEPEWVRAERMADVDESSTYAKAYSGYAWASPTELPRYWMRLPNSLGVNVESPAFFYMIGRWLGDGWVKKRNRKQDLVRICAHTKEACLLEDRLAETGMKWHRSRHQENVDVFDLSAEESKRLVPWLGRNFGEYAHGKTLPAWVYGASEAQRWALIEGYYDADGHEQASGLISAVSVSRCLAVGVRLLLHSLGVLASISKRDASTCRRIGGPEEHTMSCREAYTVSWRRENEWEKGHRIGNHVWGRVRDVQPAREATEVVDITVADDHSFVADGQVVHNCGWGPLDASGRPDKSRKGEDFRAYVGALSDLGYRSEWRILVAADYGAPTTRKRLFMLARRDGKPIVWPEPTHGKGRRKPWRTAAEIINWTLPTRSIFGRKKPLADATLRRIAAGLRRYVLDAADPFIVPLTHQGAVRVHSINEPLRTVTTAHRGEFALCAPTLIQTGYGEREGQAPRVLDLHRPLGTVVAGGAKHALVAAFLAQHYGGGENGRAPVGLSMSQPLGTVTTIDHHALIEAAFVSKFYGTSTGSPATDPLPTVTATGQHLAAVHAFLMAYYGEDVGSSVGDPLRTVTTRDRFGLVTVHGVDYQIVDIRMRMLTPRELFDAQGFPPDYKLDVEVGGKPLTKGDLTRLAGNSVCPQMSEALIAANGSEQWAEAA